MSEQEKNTEGREDRLQQLEEENRKLKEENVQLREKNLKERLYDHVNVSVRTMDIIIGALCVFFVVVLVIALANR